MGKKFQALYYSSIDLTRHCMVFNTTIVIHNFNINVTKQFFYPVIFMLSKSGVWKIYIRIINEMALITLFLADSSNTYVRTFFTWKWLHQFHSLIIYIRRSFVWICVMTDDGITLCVIDLFIFVVRLPEYNGLFEEITALVEIFLKTNKIAKPFFFISTIFIIVRVRWLRFMLQRL